MQMVTPSIIKISNVSEKAKAFVPYKENFVTTLPADYSLAILATTAGEGFYYMQQATDGLTVEYIDSADFDTVEADEKIQGADESITIENISDRAIDFVPYKENFSVRVEAEETTRFIAGSVGEVLYYLAQTTDGLTITHEV